MRFNTGCKKKLKKQAAQTKTTAHFRHRAGSEIFSAILEFMAW